MKLSITRARQQLFQVVNAVQRGRTVTVTRRGKPGLTLESDGSIMIREEPSSGRARGAAQAILTAHPGVRWAHWDHYEPLWLRGSRIPRYDGSEGELYELEFGLDHESIELTGSWDPVTARKETMKRIELHPRDYVVYAYNGLVAVTEHLLEQQESGGPR